jgi:putative RNA 2'-phosphotransferase
MKDQFKKISKTLSYWLRHAPEAGGLTLDPQGWAGTVEMLAALNAKGLKTNAALLERVVGENDKQRFELSDDGSSIRARQGHSLKVDGGWEVKTPPETLYHGTVDKFLDPIFADGLKPMNRHHVHLSVDLETATKVGSRRGKPVILEVASAEMASAGVEFALSSNGVWLVEAVAPQYLRRLD